MKSLNVLIDEYLGFCHAQKRLDEKTRKAYRIDLRQFSTHFFPSTLTDVDASALESYFSGIQRLHRSKPFPSSADSFSGTGKTAENNSTANRGTIVGNDLRPTCVRTPPYQRRNALRDAAVIELLFASGMRISELCALQPCNIHLTDDVILIYVIMHFLIY